MSFDAFISYSHAADGQLAPALQRAMQRLAKPWYRARALRVFRDESALSANPHLWSSIQTALDDAAWFVLLASPDAVASEWVNRELEHWLDNKSPDRILVVLTDGTWEWDVAPQTLAGSAVPAALRDAFSDEPRHVDLCWARTETDLDLRNSRFRDVVAQLAAPMHGIAKDELDSEDVRQHRRAGRLARGGVSALALLVVISLVFGAVAVVERNRANNKASVAAAQRLAALATSKVSTHGDLGLLIATEAFHRSDSATTRAALFGALTAMPQLIDFLPGPRDGTVSVVSPDGRLAVVGTSDGSLRFWDLTRTSVSAVTVPVPNELRKRSAARPPGTMAVTAMSFDRNGDRLFALYADGYLQVWDVATHRPSAPLFTLGAPGSTSTAVGSDIERYVAPPDMAVAVSPDGRRFAVTGLEVTTVSEWDSNTGRLIGTTPSLGTGVSDPRVFRGVAYAENGRTLYTWGSCSPTVGSFSVGDSQPVACSRRWQGLLSLASPLNQPLPQILPIVHSSAAQVQVPRIAIADDRSGRHLLLAGGRTAQHATLSDSDNKQILTGFETDSYNDVAMSHDGSVVALAASDGTITIWSPSVQHQLEPPLLGQGGEGRSVSLSDDGQILASTAFDGSTAIWDLSGAGALALGPEVASAARGVPAGSVYTVGALDGNGSRLAVASGNQYQNWRVADTPAGFARIAGPRPLPDSGAAAESDPSVLAFDGDQVVLEPAPSGTRNDRVHLVAGINPSGYVSIFDTRTAQTIGRIPATNHIATALATSALGDELAVGRADGRVERYALPSLQRVGVVLGSHTSPIEQIAYQPSGKLIASGSRSAVDLIDRSVGEIVATIGYVSAGTSVDSVSGKAAPSLGNGAVQFDATGRHLLTSGFESSRPALMWSMVPADWARAACRAARRNLTRAEWTQFLGSGVPYERTCPQWPAGP